MGPFRSFDWAVLLIYFVGSVVLGTYFFRRQRNAEDYLLAGRKMSWLPVAISIMATNTSAVSYMGIASYVFQKNVMLYMVVITLVLITPLVLYLFVSFYYNLKVYTAYEYLEKRFSPQVRSIASVLFIFLRLCWLATMLYATSIALAEITGASQVTCVLALGLGTSFYTIIGGMEGVIWTDVAQAAVFMSGLFLIGLFILSDFGWDIGRIYSIADAAGRTRMFDFSLDPRVEVTFWGTLFGYSVINLASYGVDQVVLQRYFTAKDLQASRRSVIANAVIDLPSTTLLYLVAIGLFAYFQKHSDVLPSNFSPDRVLPFFVITALPPGIAGLVIAGIMAATMSSVSSGVNSLTTASVVDFYLRYFRREAPAEHFLKASRWLSLFWGIAATLMGLFVGRLGTVLEISAKTNSFFTGILLGIFLLGILTLRANWQGTGLGALVSLIVVVCVGTMTGTSFFWYGPLGLALTMGLGYLFSLRFPAMNPEALRGLVKGHGMDGVQPLRPEAAAERMS
jgi:SSS family transporter